MGLCSMSPGDATCSLSSAVTPRPAAQQHTAVPQQRGALMYPELMFNERSIFRQPHAKPENGFIVFLLRKMCVCVCKRQACTFVLCRSKCVCQPGVYKSLLCPRQVYLLMYSCSECKSTDLQTEVVSLHTAALHEVPPPLSPLSSLHLAGAL